METVGAAVQQVDANSTAIATSTETIGKRCTEFVETVTGLNEGVDRSNEALKQATDRLDRTPVGAESIMMLMATSDFETSDTKFIDKAVEVDRTSTRLNSSH